MILVKCQGQFSLQYLHMHCQQWFRRWIASFLFATLIVKRFLDSCEEATKFSQFGRHFNHGFVGFIQSLREFLIFSFFLDLLLAAAEGLSSDEDFFVFFFFDFFFLSSLDSRLEELSELLKESELEEESDEWWQRQWWGLSPSLGRICDCVDDS